MRPSAGHAQGFTLLEATVALAVLAAAGLALFAAFNGALRMLDRAERSRQTDVGIENALAWLETVNPMQVDHSEQELGDYRLRWRADMVAPARDNDTGFLRPGLYQVALYRLRCQLWRDGRLEREFELRRVGYRQVRQPEAL